MSAPTTATGTDLADWLRSLDAAQLKSILGHRTDSMLPPPPSFTVLAHRLQATGSLTRAVERLDALGMAIIEEFSYDQWAETRTQWTDEPLPLPLGPVPLATIVTRLKTRAPKTQVVAQINRMRALALAWGPDTALSFPEGLRDALPWFNPNFTGPLAKLPTSALARMVAELTDEQRAPLQALADGSTIGTARDIGGATPDSPLGSLLELGLLARIGVSDVAIELRLASLLRGQHPPEDVWSLRPPKFTKGTPPAAVDSAAATAALTYLREATTLLDVLAARPAAVLRSGGGGIGVRELKRLAKETTAAGTAMSETEVGALLEVLLAARLIAFGNPTPEPEPTPSKRRNTRGRYQPPEPDPEILAPSMHSDFWRSSAPGQRWFELAAAWLGMSRYPTLIGQRGDNGVIGALSEYVYHPVIPVHRAIVLAQFAGAEPLSFDDATTSARFYHPTTRLTFFPEVLHQFVDAAARLGLAVKTGAEEAVLSSAGAALIPARGEVAINRESAPAVLEHIEAVADKVRAAMDATLPSPIDYFLLQADLTLTAPGPLTSEIETRVIELADLESATAAAVYRIDENSLRRGFDRGRTAAELHAWFAQHSRTPVPQSLTYLIDDVSRRHGAVRAGVAMSYLRAGDPASLTELLNSPLSDKLGLRALADTVAIANVPLGQLLTEFAGTGIAISAENAQGAIVELGPTGTRFPAHPAPHHPSRFDDARLESIIDRIRAGDAADLVHGAPGGTMNGANRGQSTGEFTRLLREAPGRVRVTYTDGNGRLTARIGTPVVRVGGDYVLVTEPDQQQLAITLHRVRSVEHL